MTKCDLEKHSHSKSQLMIDSFVTLVLALGSCGHEVDLRPPRPHRLPGASRGPEHQDCQAAQEAGPPLLKLFLRNSFSLIFGD